MPMSPHCDDSLRDWLADIAIIEAAERPAVIHATA